MSIYEQIDIAYIFQAVSELLRLTTSKAGWRVAIHGEKLSLYVSRCNLAPRPDKGLKPGREFLRLYMARLKTVFFSDLQNLTMDFGCHRALQVHEVDSRKEVCPSFCSHHGIS